MGEKVAGTHITITMEGDRERFCESSEGFLITADCQETVMSVEAWTMVPSDLRSVRAGGIPHISSGKCLAASSGAFGPVLSSGFSLSHNLFISTVGPLLFVLDEAPLQHKMLNFGLFQAKTDANGL